MAETESSNEVILVWKHHVSSTFEDNPELIFNNGVGEGGTVYLDYVYMQQALSKSDQRFHAAPILMRRSELKFDADGKTATALVSKKSVGPFQPVVFPQEHTYTIPTRIKSNDREADMERFKRMALDMVDAHLRKKRKCRPILPM